MKKEFINYFDLLGLQVNASDREISQKWISMSNAIDEEICNTTDEKKIEELNQKKELINTACETLLDSDMKAKYLNELSKVQSGEVVEVHEEKSNDETLEEILKSVDERRKAKEEENVVDVIDAQEVEENNEVETYPLAVVEVEDSEEAVIVSNKGKKVIKAVVASVLAAAILIGAGGLTYYLLSKNKDDKKKAEETKAIPKTTYTLVLEDNDEIPAITTTGNDDTLVSPEVTSSEINEAQEVANEVTTGGIINRGDAKDSKVLEERANEISKYFAISGIYNPNTMSPYTIEEIKDILLFVNGAYVPSKEADAYSMVDNHINFICANISSFRNLDMVNYLANSDVIDEKMIEEDIREYPTFDYVDAMLLGDSHCYPYLKWFNGKYNEMISTTDKEKSRAIFAEMSQSLADVVLGDGYRLDDVVYTIRDFSGKGNINDGNMLMMLVNMFSVYNTRYVKHDYVTSKRISGEFSLTIDQVASQFDLACAEDLIMLKEDDVLPDDINRDEQNYHNRLQIDTINAALTNGMLNNQEYYEDQYSLAR